MSHREMIDQLQIVQVHKQKRRTAGFEKSFGQKASRSFFTQVGASQPININRLRNVNPAPNFIAKPIISQLNRLYERIDRANHNSIRKTEQGRFDGSIK